MTGGEFLTVLTDNLRFGRTQEDDGQTYSCLIKKDEKYKQIAQKQNAPGYFDPEIHTDL